MSIELPPAGLPAKVFIVVDPSKDRPLALERALVTAKLYASTPGNESPSLHIFLAVDSDNNDTSAGNPLMHRDSEWLLKQVISPLQQSGIDYSAQISWSTDWYGSILKESKEQQADMIMLPLVNRPSSHERLFNESIWRLLRTAGCPVLIVQPDSPLERKKILAAVNFQSHKPEYQRLNDLIVARGQWIARSYGAELHIVNAYKDSLHYPDRSELANKTEVDTSNIHVKAGDPDEVIAGVAKDIGADIIVLGTRARSSRWRGNTTEKIITEVDCDILTIH